jgi:hypothetical protein
MSFKQRVGNFFLLFGSIGLLIFAASVLTPSSSYDITAFIAGVLLFGLGLNFRLSKSSGPPREAPHPVNAIAKPAAKAGPPKGGKPGGAPKPAGGAPPAKRQGMLSSILKGPPPRKTAPKPGGPGPGGGSGGGPPKKR